MPSVTLSPLSPRFVFAPVGASLLFVPSWARTLLSSALLALGLACAVAYGPAHAEKADRNKPMYIESDALRVDDLKQVSVATGKVIVTKGTIVIRGARVDVRQDAEGYQYGVATGEPGGRAFYRQKREALDEFIEGDGETIVYDGKADTVRFIKRGEMRRFKGAQLFDETSGNVIVYDNGADVFTVDSGSNPGTPGTGRVRTMLTPNPAPGAAAASPAPPASAAPLRQSSALNSSGNGPSSGPFNGPTSGTSK